MKNVKSAKKFILRVYENIYVISKEKYTDNAISSMKIIFSI